MIMKNICRTALLGATMAFATMFSTASAQKAGQFNPTGQALTNEHAYEQYKLQYMSEHPELFKQEAASAKQATGNTNADNAAYEAKKIASQPMTEAEEIREFQKNKEAIYNSDPARYEAMIQKMNAAQSASVVRVSASEYQSLPANKKAYMDANPAKYRIENTTR